MAQQTISIDNAPLTIDGVTVGLASEIEITFESKTVACQPLGSYMPAHQVTVGRSITGTIKKAHINDTYLDKFYPAATPDYSTSISIVWTLTNQTSGSVAQTTTHTITGKITSIKFGGGKDRAMAEDIQFVGTGYTVATA